MGGGGVFFDGFFLSLAISGDNCFVSKCLGKVLDRGLVTTASDAAGDFECNTMSSSALILLFFLPDGVE